LGNPPVPISERPSSAVVRKRVKMANKENINAVSFFIFFTFYFYSSLDLNRSFREATTQWVIMQCTASVIPMSFTGTWILC